MVSIIILSYNTKGLLKRCLESIVKHTKDIPHEIIIVDNASSDDSALMIKQHFPHIKLIANSENVGFAKGVNQAEKLAKGDYLLLLNSDTELIDNSLKEMVEYAKTDDAIAVVGGYLRQESNSTSKSFGKFYTLEGVFKMLFTDKAVHEVKNGSPIAVDWVSGGYMLIKRNIFDKVHGFDEHFFMYLEDMELCYRLANQNHKIIYFPSSQIAHTGQGSSNRTFAVVQIYKGIQYFYKKHKSYPEYILVKLMLMIKAVVSIAIGLLTGKEYLLRTYQKAFATTL